MWIEFQVGYFNGVYGEEELVRRFLLFAGSRLRQAKYGAATTIVSQADCLEQGWLWSLGRDRACQTRWSRQAFPGNSCCVWCTSHHRQRAVPKSGSLSGDFFCEYGKEEGKKIKYRLRGRMSWFRLSGCSKLWFYPSFERGLKNAHGTYGCLDPVLDMSVGSES